MNALAGRLSRSDMTQVVVFLLGACALVLTATWPISPAQPNDAFYAVAQLVVGAAVLLGLGYGVTLHGTNDERLHTLLGIFIALLLATPVVVAAHAASFPDVPLYWIPVAAVLNAGAAFGVGNVLGVAARAARLGVVLPLLVPAVFALLIVLDVQIVPFALSPFTVARAADPVHAVGTGLLSIATLGWLLRRPRAPKGADGP